MTHDKKPVAPRHATPADVLDLGTGEPVAEPVRGATRFEWHGYDAADAAQFLVGRVSLMADVFAAMADGHQFADESLEALYVIGAQTADALGGAIEELTRRPS